MRPENFTWARGAPAEIHPSGHHRSLGHECHSLPGIPAHLRGEPSGKHGDGAADLHGHPGPHNHVLLPGQPLSVGCLLFLSYWPKCQMGKGHQVRVSDPSFPLKMDVKLLTF